MLQELSLARIEDVAAYILLTHGEMSVREVHVQLARIQAWSLDFDGVPLFRGNSWFMEVGDPARLTAAQRETVEAVLEA